MGSPAGCECHFRQLHLNMIERSLCPENTTEMPAWRSVANSTSGITRAAASPTNIKRAIGQQRHDLPDYKEAKSALLRIRR